MKISHHWLKKYIELTQEPVQIAQLLTQIGLEVSHITQHNLLPSQVVIGDVRTCESHPNAEKLNIAQVDIGEARPKTIVCGATNLAIGQKVAVAPVGTQLPLPDGQVFPIKARKIRGQLSEGMICSLPELGLQGDPHGIWVLDTQAPAGTPLPQALDIHPDTIYDIELTPNRNDATSHWGVARDLAAALNRKIKSLSHFTLIPQSTHRIQAIVKEPHHCPRYTALMIENIKVAPSPAWLQNALKSIGLQPINNIVDITNYITHDIGQPLHAFDYKSIAQQKITIQTLPKGTSFTTLDGVVRQLSGKEIMVCDSDKPLAMAGIIGGKTSAITSQTKSIFLESAYFNPVTISQATRHHHLQTDASYRFERGTDPDIPYLALQRATQMIIQIAGGTIASCPLDLYPEKITPITLSITYRYIQKIIGIPIAPATIRQIIQRLHITLEEVSQDELKLTIPPYRRDVTRPIDIVEEILRIYGYNHKSLRASSLPPYPIPPPVAKEQLIKKEILDFFTARGYHEIKNNPLIPDIYHTHIQEINPAKSVQLANPLHDAHSTLPQTLLFGGLRALHHNLTRQQKDLTLFEIAKTYTYTSQEIQEKEYLALWATGKTAPPSWRTPPKPLTLHDLQAIIIQFLYHQGHPIPTITMTKASAYQVATHLLLPQKEPILCGEVSPHILDLMPIKQPVFFAQIPIHLLLYPPSMTYHPIPKHPYLTRDISISIPQHVSYAILHKYLQELKAPQIKAYYVIDIYRGEAVGDQKAYTLRFLLQDDYQTLHDKKINQIMQKITQICQKKLHATIRE